MRIAAIGLVLLALGPASAAGDGAPDPSFGSAGSVSFAPQRFSGASGVAVDAQGRIVVGATVDDGFLLRTRAAVLRLLPNGSLDPSFGSAGVATIPPPAPYVTSQGGAIALDAQGRIVVAGAVGDDVPAVSRLLPDGTLDPAFASGGTLVAAGAYGGLPGGWYSAALDGASIVLAGAVDSAPPFGTGLGRVGVVARIADNGVPDAAFASGGFLLLPIPGVTSVSGEAIDHSGRIVLGIWRATTDAFPGDVAAGVVRVTATGALDATFGSGGLVVLGPLQRRAPSVSVTRTGGIVVLGGWSSRAGAAPTIAARLRPSGQLDAAFGTGGELIPPASVSAVAGILDCQGDLLVSGNDGVRRFGPDGRLDPTFRRTAIPPVAVGATTAAVIYGAVALTAGGAIVLAGTASDGPTVVGGATQVGHNAIAVARVTAACPLVDTRPPTVTLTCATGCRRVIGSALDDPVGHGVRRVLLGVERIRGTRCEAWDGRRFAVLPCARAAARLVPVKLVAGAFRSPALRSGRYVVRAVAVDRDGNQSRFAVRRAGES